MFLLRHFLEVQRWIFLTLSLALFTSAIFPNTAHAQDLPTNAVLTTAYTADTNGPYGYNGNNSGLNMGHRFTITGTNLLVYSVGVYNYGGGGLVQNHVVSVMTNNEDGTYTAIQGGTVVVPAGTNTVLSNAYRYQPLPAPLTLGPGNYGVVAFNMTGWPGSDAYSDGYETNNGFIGTPGLTNVSTIFEFLAHSFQLFHHLAAT